LQRSRGTAALDLKRTQADRAAKAFMSLMIAASSAFSASPPDLNGVWSPTGQTLVRGTPAATGQVLGPLRPEARQRHEAFNRIVSPTGDTPGGVCLGAGLPGMLMGGGGYPMEIIHQPNQITLIFELHGETRRIYFGARNVPEQDRVPGRAGYSSGRWEGDVLVVETNNLVEQLDQRTTPHSAEATVVERFRIQEPSDQGGRILSVEVTMTDPLFYTEPVVFTRRWTEVPNGHLLPYECNEEMWRDRVEALARKAQLEVP